MSESVSQVMYGGPGGSPGDPEELVETDHPGNNHLLVPGKVQVGRDLLFRGRGVGSLDSGVDQGSV